MLGKKCRLRNETSLSAFHYVHEYPQGNDRESVSENNLIQQYEKQGLHEPSYHLIRTGSLVLFGVFCCIVFLVLENHSFETTLKNGHS